MRFLSSTSLAPAGLGHASRFSTNACATWAMASTHCLLSGGARRELQGHLAAQARLEGDQLQRVLEGEDVIIAKAGKPVAVLSPLPSTAVRRIPGNDAGTVIITPAFDEPLPEFDEL